VTCSRDALRPGATTRAHVPVSVAADAARGVPSVTLSGPGVVRTTATASRGVGSEGLGAVFAAMGPVTVVAGGNALLSCRAAAPGCLTARAGSPSQAVPVDNDAYAMTSFADPSAPRGAPGGTAVSGARIALGGEVVWAGLYWAGNGIAPRAPTAYVRSPGGGDYHVVVADRVYEIPPGGRRPAAYQAVADVTGLVRAVAATGTWWVAVDADAFDTGVGVFGGWALLAVVESGSKVRAVAVLDGGIAVRSGAPVSSTVYGLAGGATTVGLLAWEGDRGATGDSVTLDGSVLGGSATNVLRSRADGTPPNWNTFGTDAWVVAAAGRAGSQAPAVTAATGFDAWVLGALALVTDPAAS
jgi:hypothetical protein